MIKILLISFSYFCFGFGHSQTYNIIDFKKVGINNVFLGDSKSFITKKNGVPRNIVKYENPSGDDWHYNYHYKNSILEVSPENKFSGFKIVDSVFMLTINFKSIQIGDSIDVLMKMFPLSAKLYKIHKDYKFRLLFKDSESYIIFNIKHGHIVKIETWDEI